MVVREACPACGSERFKRHGHIHTGQQNHQCKACGRQFVLYADNRVIGDEQRSDSRSALKIRYDLCRLPLSEPSDDPCVACDASCTAGIESILGTKPLLASAEVELGHSHGTGASARA
jgi:hypothetical protein